MNLGIKSPALGFLWDKRYTQTIDHQEVYQGASASSQPHSLSSPLAARVLTPPAFSLPTLQVHFSHKHLFHRVFEVSRHLIILSHLLSQHLLQPGRWWCGQLCESVAEEGSTAQDGWVLPGMNWLTYRSLPPTSPYLVPHVQSWLMNNKEAWEMQLN